MRVLLLGVLVSGCAGFSQVQRGEWQHVWVDPGTKDREEIITRDQSEEELALGTRRTWEPVAGQLIPRLDETEAIGVQVGEVMELEVDEASDVGLELKGGAAQVFWNPMRKVDGWKDGMDVTTRKSRLFVVGRSPGVTTLKVTRVDVTREVPITVGVKDP